jgi:hypothetical protein
MRIADAFDLVFAEQERAMHGTSDDLHEGRSIRVTSNPRATERRPDVTCGVGPGGGPLPGLLPAEARRLTDRIRTARHEASVLLLEAHERRAWSALGYKTWSDYVRTELRLSHSRSYELLDHGRVLKTLAAAGGMSGIPDISPYAAAQIKDRLHELVEQLTSRSAVMSEEQTQHLISETVLKLRASGVRPERMTRRGVQLRSQGLPRSRTATPYGFDVGALTEVIEYLAQLPPPKTLGSVGYPFGSDEWAAIDSAIRWLTEFGELFAGDRLANTAYGNSEYTAESVAS